MNRTLIIIAFLITLFVYAWLNRYSVQGGCLVDHWTGELSQPRVHIK